MLHLTFDLELYDPIKFDEKIKERFILEQENILKKIFSILNENRVKITCFVTNEFVENFYDFFHKYVVGKHEVACHTAKHLFYDKKKNNLQEFINDIRRNKKYLEKETGGNCIGFRAPGGVIPKNLPTILKEIGFKYDSSVVPGIIPGRYNNSKAPREPYFPRPDNILIPTDTDKIIIEFPVLTTKIFKISVNGYFFSYYSKFIKLNDYDKTYGVVYIHPYDFKKFGLFDKGYIWDKMKCTRCYWQFLRIYTQKYTNVDTSLYKLAKNKGLVRE